MSKNRIVQPNFKWSFLLPKYWLVWLGIFLQVSVSWLPFKLQIFLGKLLGSLIYKLNLKRTRVALKNLELCFPDLSPEEHQDLLKRNMQSTAIGLFEVGMGWWWPNWRVKKHGAITGIEHLERAQQAGKGTLLLSVHNMSIEINCRSVGLSHPTVVLYRPHNNMLMEYFQYRGRIKTNKYMIGRHDIKSFMKALRAGETCIYFPDQDYGRKRSLFIPFFGVKDTPTTTGTLALARQKNTQVCLGIPMRNKDNSGYTIEILPPFKNFPTGDDEADLLLINQTIEKAIMKNPDQYMWLHRRFKTRPDINAPSLYK